MIGFSANLGFLWPELDLYGAIESASKAGFDAVECHWPYTLPAADVYEVLVQSRIPMLAINTRPGKLDSDEFGLTAVPGRHNQAREYIDEAIVYAAQIRCPNIHVMAGKTSAGELAQLTYLENLNYACSKAAEREITVLIEPINQRDVPGYHLSSIDSAVETLLALDHDNIKILFDCYHIQIMQGNIINHIKTCINTIGHVQIASVPDRVEPDVGELNYAYIINALKQMGYKGYIGAEYKPSGLTCENLGWLQDFKSLIT